MFISVIAAPVHLVRVVAKTFISDWHEASGLV
jgi:hypothetical protein